MNTIKQHQFCSPGISNVPTTLEEISSKLADSPSPTHEDWEKADKIKDTWNSKFESMLKDYADNIYYEGDPKRTKATTEQDLKSLISSLLAAEERKVRERVRDWVEMMWKYDNNGWTDKDEIVASIQSYLEGKHKPK